MFGGVVAHGPFSGFRMQQTQYWSHYDATAKLFGLYEKEVADELVRFRLLMTPSSTLARPTAISVSRRYAVAIFSNPSVSRYRRQADDIRHAAELNGVAERVDIRGEADAAELKKSSTGARDRPQC